MDSRRRDLSSIVSAYGSKKADGDVSIRPRGGPMKDRDVKLRSNATKSVSRGRYAVTKTPINLQEKIHNYDSASDCGTSSITIDAVPDALMRCNSPFMDAIFGASDTGKDMTGKIVNHHHPAQLNVNEHGHNRDRDRGHTGSWQARQMIARSLLPPKATMRAQSSLSPSKFPNSHKEQHQQKRGWSSGAGFTTGDSVSEMSNFSDFHEDIDKRTDIKGDMPMNGTDGAEAGGYAPENQTRIMAPNVDRLTALSIQEVVIQGEEMVSVLASTDVLKMRSAFFFDLIMSQERKRESDVASTSSTFRPPIIIEDPSPYECAAYLESLHECKPPPPVEGEWSYSWARLSVQWRVTDLMSDFARILDKNIEALLSKIEQNHWRTNPNYLRDAAITIIKPGSNSKIEVLTGIIVESKVAVPYGSLRIAIEKDEATPEINELDRSSLSVLAHGSMTPQREIKRAKGHDQSQQARRKTTSQLSATGKQALDISNETSLDESLHYIGSSQPLTLNTGFTSVAWADFETKLTTEQQVTILDDDAVWIRRSGPGNAWVKPDAVCLEAARKTVSASEGAAFWEMVRAIVELSDLREQCKGRMCANSDIAAILSRKEFHVLWSFNERVPGFLPKRCALQLIQESYSHTV